MYTPRVRRVRWTLLLSGAAMQSVQLADVNQQGPSIAAHTFANLEKNAEMVIGGARLRRRSIAGPVPRSTVTKGASAPAMEALPGPGCH